MANQQQFPWLDGVPGIHNAPDTVRCAVCHMSYQKHIYGYTLRQATFTFDNFVGDVEMCSECGDDYLRGETDFPAWLPRNMVLVNGSCVDD